MPAVAVRTLLARLRFARLSGRAGDPLPERALAVVTAVVVAVGFVLRARGYLWHPSAFWLDESSWAMNLVEQPLLELCIRPIGFMLVSRLLADVFSLSEPVLRAMPWLASIVGLALTPALARRLFVAPAARLLLVSIIALHPVAIDFAKEFKPYSVSLTLHLALMLLVLRYVDSKAKRDLWWLLGLATAGGLFAQDLLFAYPGTFLLAGWTALRARREHLRVIAAAAGLIVALLLLQYFFIWSQFPASDTKVWGDKYNVFFGGKDGTSYLGWWLGRHESMAVFPGYRARFWQVPFMHKGDAGALRAFDAVVWVCLHLAGLAVIAWRRRDRALLLVLPVIVLWLFNFVRLWPIGAFRANLFVIAYMSGIACMAFDFSDRAQARLRDLVPAFVLVLAPFLFLDKYWSNHKQALTYESEFPRAVRAILQAQMATDSKEPEPLLLDRRSCDPYRFYTEFHPSATRHLRHLLQAHFVVTCVTDDDRFRHQLLARMPYAPHHAWAILHSPQAVTQMIHRHQLGDSELTFHERVGAHGLMAFWRPLRARPAPPEDVAAPVDRGGAPREEPAQEGGEEPDQGPNSRF